MLAIETLKLILLKFKVVLNTQLHKMTRQETNRARSIHETDLRNVDNVYFVQRRGERGQK